MGSTPPGYLAVRQWVLRVGYYKLHQSVQWAQDWIYIVDYAHQIGLEKCLLILGVRLSSLRSWEDCTLHLPQIQVLDISLCRWSSGEGLYKRLQKVEQRVGPAVQIVADGESSIKKGIRLYQQSRQQPPMYTYDISHQAGLILEDLLSDHPEWLSLCAQLNQIQKSTMQTHAAFLSPPSLRKKARYMNLYTVVEWAVKLLEYDHRGDYSLVANVWQFEAQSFDSFVQTHKISVQPSARDELLQLKLHSEQSLRQALTQAVPDIPLSQALPLIHNGDQEFRRLFGALLSMRYFLLCLYQLMELVKSILEDLKVKGLSKSRLQIWKEFPDELLEKPASDFWNIWKRKMDTYEQSLPDDLTYLATSDIIESLFGHYKAANNNYWLRGMSAGILMMPALAGALDPELVKQALLHTRFSQVEQWFNQQRLERSFLSKRLNALARPHKKNGLKMVGAKPPSVVQYETA